MKASLLQLRYFTILLLLLAGCDGAVAVNVFNRPEPFNIKSEANLVSSEDYTLEWSSNPNARSYEIIIARDEACADVIFEKSNLKTTSYKLDSLSDGKYYFCVFARFKTARLAAHNNGLWTIIDRAAPIISVPSDTVVYTKPFTPDLTAKDVSALSVQWSQVSGDGIVSFDDALSLTPIVSVDINGIYKIKATITDQAGHRVEQIYQFYWNATVESNVNFVSLTRSGVASDGYINAGESSDLNSVWTLTQTGASLIQYTIPLDDPSGTVVCDATQDYSKIAVPSAFEITTDGSFSICVRLKSASGKIVFGKSDKITRDVVAPLYTSLAMANAATDGIINLSESASTNPLWTLTASGQDLVSYSAPFDDSLGTLICDATVIYSQTLIPTATALTIDGTYAICAQLKDLAGNTAYGKSSQVLRDIAPPIFTSYALANAATDGSISDSEKALGSALWSLTASSYSQALYSAALSDSGGSLVCDGTVSYSLMTIPIASSLLSDGAFASCVKLSDAAGNLTFGKSAQVIRDISGPTISSFAGTGIAADGFINASEISDTGALWALTQSGAISTQYTTALGNSAGSLVCDASQTYNQSSIPRSVDLTVDGPYSICVKLTDSLGNITYGKADQVTRGTVGPTFGSLTPANDASDNYINDSEKASTAALWTLSESGSSTIEYTVLLDDTGGSVTCDVSQTYSQSTIPRAVDMASDKPWTICVKLTDANALISYGKANPVTRDIISPVFTSLVKANAASDGYITDDEKLLVNALWNLTASGHTTAAYTPAMLEIMTGVICDAGQIYSQSTIPSPASLSSDDVYIACVKLSDLAGNTVYGKSDFITRDVVAPVFTSLAAANEAADGFINDADKASVQPLYTLSASGHVSASYTALLDDSTPVTCDSGKTYGGSIPTIASVTPDGTYAICVVLSDTAGNKTYGKSAQVIRDVAFPSFTSLALANAATDGYINDAEKSLTTDLWTLTASGYSAIAYTAPSNDAAGVLTCNAARSYNQPSIPTASSLTSDGTYSICVRLSDASGNIAYGKAVSVVRNIGLPTFTSLNRANEASDGVINAAEKNATNPLFTLSASGQSGADYTAPTIETSPAIICDSTQSYTLSAIPTPASITSDGTYVVCARVKDSALNYAYGKSQSVLRDATPPTVTVTSVSTTDLTPPLSGTINDPAATISVAVNNRSYTAVNNGDGTWSIADNTLAMTGFGVYNVVATATDIYGNAASDATTGELNITAPAFTTAWKTDNPGVTNSQSIKLPLVAGGTYNFVVQWGDGSDNIITSWNAAATTHSYASAGTYTVTINGTLTGWQFADLGDKSKITNISKWAILRLTDVGEYFAGANNMTITATDIPDFTGITNFTRIFHLCSSLTTVPNMGQWNVSSVVTFEGAFRFATNFNEDIGAWNTVSATNMGAMFENAEKFNYSLNSWNMTSVGLTWYMFAGALLFNGDITGWNTASIYDMNHMFFNAKAFNRNISTWNVSNVLWMAGMFRDTTYNQNISNWNTSKVRGFDEMFRNNPVFNQPIESWNTSQALYMWRMFQQATAFNRPIGSWDVSKVQDMSGMFYEATNFNQPLNSWLTSNVTNMGEMFYRATAFNQPLNSWNVSKVAYMDSMFHEMSFNQDITGWNVGLVVNFNEMFCGNPAFNQPINSWIVSSATDMGRMFAYSSFNQNLNSWNVSNVVWMNEMFRENHAFNGNISNWNVGNVVSMQDMFGQATMFNQDISLWDVDHVQDFTGMFSFASVFNQNLNSWNVSAATSMRYMFHWALAFNGNISNWNTSNVINMEFMFRDARVFNQNINSWNVGNVTNMDSMFLAAYAYNQPMNLWNTSKVTIMAFMFHLNAVFNNNISTWNTGAVTNMDSMFRNTYNFAGDVSTWNVSNVTNMAGMFANAEKFNSNIAAWNVSKVTNMQSMFEKALLFNQDISAWNTSAVTNTSYMFSEASAFNQNISSWDVSHATTIERMFRLAGAFNQDLSAWSPIAATTMYEFMLNSPLTQANYTALLNSWAGKAVQNGVYFGVGTTKYLAGASAAHANLVSRGWVIADGGLGP